AGEEGRPADRNRSARLSGAVGPGKRGARGGRGVFGGSKDGGRTDARQLSSKRATSVGHGAAGACRRRSFASTGRGGTNPNHTSIRSRQPSANEPAPTNSPG